MVDGRHQLAAAVSWAYLIAFAGSTSVALAQQNAPGKRQVSYTAAVVDASSDPMREVTPEREAAAETFARLHHPELAELLSRLRSSRHGEYDNAVRQLFRESERLAKLKGRDSQRYELELENWKIGSRIQLAVARLAMGETPELREELTRLLKAKITARTALVQLDRQKTAARLERLDTELANLQTDPAGQAEKELDKLLRSAKVRAARAARQSQTNKSRKADTSDSADTAKSPSSNESRPSDAKDESQTKQK